ncbi:MAG: DUF3048 domain-containing protein [Streptosporangiales bacterium]|nr:DUF3048 domain-containing protein [Streptosporangiales bacterium]
MGEDHSLRIRRLPTATAVALAAATAIAGCSSGGGGTPGTAAPPPSPPKASQKPPPAKHPFTGLTRGLGGRVLAVKVDNTEAAHPQYGVRNADLVYVEQVEGGVTRLMAVFSSKLPNRVGPIRSARISDLHILRQFGKPAFAYSGAQGKLKPKIADAPLYDVSQDSGASGYSRTSRDIAPYNLLARPKSLRAQAKKASKPRDIGLTFAEQAPAGGKDKSKVRVSYARAKFQFSWSKKRKAWMISQDGGRDMAAEGGQLGAQNIVVQWVKTTRSKYHDFLNNYTPLIHTTGEGKAVVLRDGKAYAARWEREDDSDGTKFTQADGSPMPLHPGRTWVVLAARKPVIP